MITIYGASWCGPCHASKEMCDAAYLEYEFIDVQKDKDAGLMFKEKGYKTVPQIFNDGIHIGGSEDLKQYIQELK